MLSRVCSFFCVALVISMGCQAEISREDWQAFNYGVAKYYVGSAYSRLREQSVELVTTVDRHCTSPDENSLALSKQAFFGVMQAWQGIQHIRFGPVEIMMRGFDMQYWPDKKNYIGKEMALLLSAKDPAVIASDKFYQLSVSIKGLPVIERLLFDKDYSTDLTPESYHCEYLKRVSRHVLEMAEGLDKEWQKDMIPAFTLYGEDEYFFDETEAATSLLKALIEPIEVIEDLKLKKPLGSKKAKLRKLESWRSQSSLDNIRTNIKALKVMYSGGYLNKVGGQDKTPVKSLASILSLQEQEQIDQAFHHVEGALLKFKQPLETVITSDEGREKTLALVSALDALNKVLIEAVSQEGIHLGFNSRDGD